MRIKHPFKRKDNLYKNVKANTREELREIEKITDHDERLERYEAVTEKLQGFYDDGKPRTMNHDTAGIAAMPGGLLGMAAACFVAGGLAFPFTAPIVAAVIGGGLVVGAVSGFGLGDLVGNRKERKEIRAKYGSVRNAHTMYKLEKAVEKKAGKERALDRAAKLQQQFDEAFKRKETAPAVETASSARKPRRILGFRVF